MENFNQKSTPDVYDSQPLPEVAGRSMSTSNERFETKCKYYIKQEQEQINPDNGLIDCLCEAVRCVREYSDMMNKQAPYE